jgi:hypothetical protein
MTERPQPLPWHGYATFGVQYAREPHPTLPVHIADPEKVIEIWAPSREVARRLITGLTMTSLDSTGNPVSAAYSALNDWPRTLAEEGQMAHYFPGGVSLIIDCREL